MSDFSCPYCGHAVEPEHLYCPFCSRALRLSDDPSVPQAAPTKGFPWVAGIGLLIIAMTVYMVIAIFRPLEVRNKPPELAGRWCAGQIEQLATAFLMYAADCDDVLPHDPNFKASVMPYVRNAEQFACPNTMIEFAVNDDLVGKNITNLLDVTTTVMLYEGYQKKLSGPHDGRSSVAYADGHTKLIEATAAVDYSVKLGKPVTPTKSSMP